MLENIGKFYILNGNIEISKDYQKKRYTDRIYEVIRIVDGEPLFLKDHFQRLQGSAGLLNKTLPLTLEQLKNDIEKIIEVDEILNNNLMLITYFDNNDPWYIIYFRKSSYPCIDMYKDGVDTELFNLARSNPNAKILNLQYRDLVNEQIEKNKVFEIILINEKGIVTEGSRTNIFFYKNNCFYTAPSKLVLMGITRKYIIEIIKESGFGFEEKSIFPEELSSYEGAFLTGTSIGVLPVNSIGDITYDILNADPIYSIHKKYNSFVRMIIKSC